MKNAAVITSISPRVPLGTDNGEALARRAHDNLERFKESAAKRRLEWFDASGRFRQISPELVRRLAAVSESDRGHEMLLPQRAAPDHR